MLNKLGMLGNNEKSAWKWFILPTLAIVLLVGIGPMIYSLFISTFQYNMAKTSIPFKFIGLQNYISLFTDPKVWNSFKLSFYFILIAVSVEMIVGTLMALLLVNSIKGRNIFRSLFLIPMVIPPIAVGLMGRFILDDRVGFINALIRALGGPRIMWYGNPKWSLFTMISLDVWEWSSFIFIIVLAGLMAIPDEFYEAARVEGSSYFGELFKITIPTLKNVFILAATLRIIDAFKEFDKIYIITTGGPNFATDLITIRNYTIAFKEFDIGRGTAMSIIILMVAILLGTFLVRQLRRETK